VKSLEAGVRLWDYLAKIKRLKNKTQLTGLLHQQRKSGKTISIQSRNIRPIAGER